MRTKGIARNVARSQHTLGWACKWPIAALAIILLHFAAYSQKGDGQITPSGGSTVSLDINQYLVSAKNGKGYKVKAGYKLLKDENAGRYYIAPKNNRSGKNTRTIRIQTGAGGRLIDTPVIVQVYCECNDGVAVGSCRLSVSANAVVCEPNYDRDDLCTRCQLRVRIPDQLTQGL